MPQTLVFINRSFGCPMATLARRVLDDHGVPFREVFYDEDPVWRERLLAWVGFLSVPTLFIADDVVDPDAPTIMPEPLEPGTSPRGIDRGMMITEPFEDELLRWVRKVGLLAAE
ncbi:MAG: glutaredoxin family protein [Anaerolineae bacterium]|jgi:glutaredoxin|nr:glutaredoxin family protein [Anaerolineae bacterium]